MSIIEKTIQSFRRFLVGERRGASFDSLGSGLPSGSGTRLALGSDVDTAMRFTAVYAAIRLRSNTIASLPKSAYDLTDDGRVEAATHPVFRLLKHRPNRFQNPFSFWNFVNTCVDGWGNGYVIIRRKKGASPEELIPVHPQHVLIVLVEGRKWYKVVGTKYWDGLYSDEDMLHFYVFSKDGVKGVNPIEYNHGAIARGIGSQEYGNSFFQRMGNMHAVIETDERLTKEKVNTFLSNFEESKKYGNPLLTHGFKWKDITLSPESAQMIESSTFALQDVCRIFMVPPHLLGDLSRSTFSNIEHQGIEFVKHYIRPTVKMYEQEIDRKLFFEDEWGRMETKFNLDGLLRGDLASRADFYQKAVLGGWLSRNEARRMEHLNPKEGLDEMLYPSNENIVGQQQPQK